MSKIYPGLTTINGNLLVAIDLETTGREPGYHEIIQIAILPLDNNIRPLKDVRPFYTTIRPDYPERQEPGAARVHRLTLSELLLHAPTQDRVADYLLEWFHHLELPHSRTLTPLAQNWSFERAFLTAWLGVDMVDTLFHPLARDPMSFAIALNDQAAFRGEELPFAHVGLGSLCNRFGITNETAHDALSDCFATAEVYRAMLALNLVM